MPVALLFDLDGTLIQGAGAGTRAMLKAVAEWVGGHREIAKTDMAGRTDPDIFRELLKQVGVDCSVPPPDLVDLYVRHLRHEVRLTPGKPAPGVREVVEACHGDGAFRLALATGNIEAGARIKLEPHGLNPFFPVGGYGCDSNDRMRLVARAWQRVVEREGGRPMAAVVIGDTPRDIQAAHANGLRCIAIATGPFTSEALAAAGADVVLNDLSRPDDFFAAVNSCVGPTP